MLPHLRLLQLASPSLPVGAYAYSQGLEWAVEAGWVHDEASLREWLAEQLEHSLERVDLPVLCRALHAARRDDVPALSEWAARLVAMRETSELVADDANRGAALLRLLRDLDVPAADGWLGRGRVPFVVPYALAACRWDIEDDVAVASYAWSWLENQALAGVRLIPLGQAASQRVMLEVAERIPGAASRAMALEDDDLGGTLPSLAIASSRHETQYTRLFRS